MTDASIRRRVVVSGHVQGVFFRASVAERARSGSVAGWVRNRPDGTVEAVFEGAPADVERLIAWCREGPPAAGVERVDVSEEPVEGLVGFGPG